MVLKSLFVQHWIKQFLIWDLTTKQKLRELAGCSEKARDMIELNSHRLAVVYSNTVKIWNIYTGACFCTLQIYNSMFLTAISLAELANSTLITCSKTLKLWRLNKERKAYTCYKTLEESFEVMAKVNHEKFACGTKNKIQLFKLSNGSLTTEKELFTYDEEINALCCLSDEITLVSDSDTQIIKVWDIQLGVLLKSLKGSNDYVYSFVGFGNMLISASWDGVIKMWDLKRGECIKSVLPLWKNCGHLAKLDRNVFISCNAKGVVTFYEFAH